MTFARTFRLKPVTWNMIRHRTYITLWAMDNTDRSDPSYPTKVISGP